MEVSQFWYGTQISSGAGSGVILSEDGYILTCAHVISGVDTIQVTTYDGTEYEAEVVGSYEDGDIAVLKIDTDGLQAATLGDSDQVRVGETVYAVGNPGGTLSGTVTDGIISALDRDITVSIESESNVPGMKNSTKTISLTVLQTSAAVSPGNSGGGLFNADGELIGMVNAKGVNSNQEGLGFAILVNTIQKVAESLINDGSYTDDKTAKSDNNAVLEITAAEVNQAMAAMLEAEEGVYVQNVQADGASDGKLEVNDRLISIDDDMIQSTEDLTKKLTGYAPGDTVTLSVEREGKLVSVEITLAKKQMLLNNR